MGGSSGGGSKKGQNSGSTSAPPTVSQPPVSQAGVQNLSAVESQFANAPWSEPGWQSNVNPINQGFQSQYLGQGNTASESSASTDQLSQWLFGGSSGEG